LNNAVEDQRFAGSAAVAALLAVLRGEQRLKSRVKGTRAKRACPVFSRKVRSTLCESFR
jgi:hypothetical protein